MRPNRRKFLKYTLGGAGAAIGSTSWWVATSKRRAARWVRTIIEDARRPILPAPFKPEPATWSDNAITLAWLGHSTVLINFYGITLLTDPALGKRVGISLGLGTAGPKRFIAPGLTLKQLPAIDVVLLSHGHMDHMDLPSLARLSKAPLTVTAKLTQDILARTGLRNITELSWNEQTTFRSSEGELEIEAIEVKHWGQRWPSEPRTGSRNGQLGRRVIHRSCTSSNVPAKQRTDERAHRARQGRPRTRTGTACVNLCGPDVCVPDELTHYSR